MRLLLLTVGSVGLLGIAAADTIMLKSGRIIEGTYLGGTARQVRVDTGSEIQTLNVSEVSRIEFSASATAQGAVTKEPALTRNTTTRTPNQLNVAELPPSGSTPRADEVAFISVLGSFKTRYKAAPNEFQKSALRRVRAAELARICRVVQPTAGLELFQL